MIPAVFHARPNRFIVEADLTDGERVRAHLADPGRLRELLVPGAPLRLRRAPPSAKRKTRYSVDSVRAADARRPWVSVVTTRANTLARALLEDGSLDELGGPEWSVRAEVPMGPSRFDFLLERPGHGEVVVEVKSVTLVKDGVGLFPDAPTRRGVRHLTELAERARGGNGAAVVFVVQRGDARQVRPHAGIDADFCAALDAAHRAGVVLRAALFSLSADGRARFLGPIPVSLER